MTSPRSGFTLVEILASIALFLVVAAAIMGIFIAATNVYRDGEAARAANDEAIAALTTLDDDLRHALPPGQGGFFFCQVVSPNGAHHAGNYVLAFTIRNPDPSRIQSDGTGARLLVIYTVDNQGPPGQSAATLNRIEVAEPGDAPWNGALFPVLSTHWSSSAPFASPVARGCLYLGVELSPPGTPRPDLDWSGSGTGTSDWCTEVIGANDAKPMPAAVRITLVMTGQLTADQRLTSRVFVIRDEPTGILVGGVRQLPVGVGAMVRVGDPAAGSSAPVEWMRIDSVAGNRLTQRNATTGILERPVGGERNTQPSVSGTHQRDEPVVWGTTYTLVRRLLP